MLDFLLRGARARSSEEESSGSMPRALRFDIDFARRLLRAKFAASVSCVAAPVAASAFLVDVGWWDWRNEVSPGVPDPDPLKRDISSDLCESVCGVADPGLGARSLTCEVPGATAVAETVDIFGAAPCDGARWSSREVIWCASGALCVLSCCDQSRASMRSFAGEAAREGGLEFAALAGGLAELRPEEAPATELARERDGEAEALASVQPSSWSSPFVVVFARSKCTLDLLWWLILVWLAERFMAVATLAFLTSACDLLRRRVLGRVGAVVSPRGNLGSSTPSIVGVVGLPGVDVWRRRSLLASRSPACAFSFWSARVLGTLPCNRWPTACFVFALCSLCGGVLDRVSDPVSVALVFVLRCPCAPAWVGRLLLSGIIAYCLGAMAMWWYMCR